MKNIEIIEMAKLAAGIEEDVKVNTLPGWNRLGKKVKAGEKAVFAARIWKPKTRKKKMESDEEVVEESTNGRMYLVNAYFFTEEQVV